MGVFVRVASVGTSPGAETAPTETEIRTPTLAYVGQTLSSFAGITHTGGVYGFSGGPLFRFFALCCAWLHCCVLVSF